MKKPNRLPNRLLRPREFLYPDEVQRLLEAARTMKHALRNETLILFSCNRGNRPSETINLRWSHIDLDHKVAHIVRLKSGLSGIHKIEGPEFDLLSQLNEQRKKNNLQSPYVFVTDKDDKLSVRTYADIIWNAGKIAGFPFKIHPHMFRHTFAEEAVRNGIDPYALKAHLGHVSMLTTMRYITQRGNSSLQPMFGV